MKVLKHNKPFLLECGVSLSFLNIGYHTYGNLNKNKDNVIWICHALTANSDALDWWNGLVGEGKLIDTKKYFVVCANNLGSCYGASNPRDINPKTQKEYKQKFPLVTIRDMVNSHDILRKQLNINKINLLIGGSMGGQICLEWGIMQPQVAENICVLATNAKHSSWGIAFNETQRMALEADPSLYSNTNDAGRKGLESARAVAMLSYRNYFTYNATQVETIDEKKEDFKASSYQRYQGYKLWKRFDPLSYLSLTKSMDSHNLGRERGGVEKALKLIKSRVLVIGIQSDFLFPILEQKEIADHISNSRLEIINSPYGHDGFLIESEQITTIVSSFLDGVLDSESERSHSYLPGTESF